MLHVALAVLHLAIAAPLAAQAPACQAITNADVAPVVGTAAAKSTPRGCSWRVDATHFVVVLDNTPRNAAMPVDAMFGASRQAAAQNGKVTDEPGLGDAAYLAVASSGLAALQVKKGGRLLQVQVLNGGAPSASTLVLLRKLAAKAVAAM